MNKTLALIVILLFLAACSPTMKARPTTVPREPIVIPEPQPKEVSIEEVKSVPEVEEEIGKLHLDDRLAAQLDEINGIEKPVKSTPLSKVYRAAAVMGSFDVVRKYYPDIKEIDTVSKTGNKNIYRISEEVWYYSRSADITFIQVKDEDAIVGYIHDHPDYLHSSEIHNALLPWKEHAKLILQLMG